MTVPQRLLIDEPARQILIEVKAAAQTHSAAR